MQRKSFVAIFGLATLVVSSLCYAEMSVPYGWYVEANLGTTRIHNTSFPNTVTSSSSGIGGNFNLGYKFMPFFAMELGYTQYSNTNLKDHFNNNIATIRNYSYDLAMKGIVPIVDSGFEIFAKLGVARVNAHTSVNNQNAAIAAGVSNSQRSKTGFYMGVGGQYYFMPEFAVNVQWQEAQGNSSTGSMDLLSIGVSYIFD